ncbi:MAG TPA: XRE family transcriptional regulator [Fusobacterium sp.]|uniref:XRE family transcriptional regulator n=2 Tax=Fusobacterium TaxID=848 RepID=A0A323TTV5_FUSNU|nr:hypothetical protein CQA79_11410 [Fusobacterium nucleatum]PZA04005.1 XRE family transcriptional regulator [Fusobacterium nucleatum]HCE32472.1 XRE family transcriptional regulator [Fusobacterium sp.]
MRGFFMKLNEKIKDLRVKNNLTQKEFAKKIGVSLSSLQKYEYADFKPSVEILKKICDAFKISLIDFLNVDDIQEEEKKIILWDMENLNDLNETFDKNKKTLDFMFEYIDLNDEDKMFMYLLVYLGYGFSFNVDKKELTVFFDTSASFYLDNSLRYTTLKVNEISSFIKLIIETLNMSILNILILRSKKN